VESSVAPVAASANEPAVKTMLIDTDVHETPPLYIGEALLPYIDPHWQRFLKREGGIWMGEPEPSTYAAPVANGREDWRDDGRPAGRTVESLRHHLLDGEGVSIAILNGPNFHPASMPSDPEFAAALASAYNDLQIAEWLDKDDRLRGSIHVGADPALAAREIERVAAHPQIVQVFLPLIPEKQWGDPMYRPIFDAAVRNDLVVTFHHGSETRTLLGFPRYFIEWHTLAAPGCAQNQIVSLMFNGVFDEFPELKVVMLEGGVSWVPWLIWRMDQQYRELRANVPWVKRLPSEHIRDSVRISTQPMTEVTAKEFEQLVEMSGTERVFVFATDFPHYDADSPQAVLSGLSDELQQRIRYRNAIETYPRLSGLA
jgi:predicted TIM-barrel fold metal-dependent hydrolase